MTEHTNAAGTRPAVKIAAIDETCDRLERLIDEQIREIKAFCGMVSDDAIHARVKLARKETDSVDRYAILASISQDMSNQLATLVLSLYERPAAFVDA